MKIEVNVKNPEEEKNFMTVTEAEKIISSLGTCEILCQLAEESSELAQAALKMRRALDSKNRTPKSKEDCLRNLVEEIADVETALDFLDLSPEIYCFSEMIKKEKKIRWANRIKEARKNESTGR